MIIAEIQNLSTRKHRKFGENITNPANSSKSPIIYRNLTERKPELQRELDLYYRVFAITPKDIGYTIYKTKPYRVTVIPSTNLSNSSCHNKLSSIKPERSGTPNFLL